ncbi:MAG: GNAT family N-acetyltransferase [bacterium]
MVNDLEIRDIEDTDVEAAVSLHNDYYGEDRTAEQWLWEYKSNYRDLFVFNVAESGGRIIATQGMIPIYVNIKGKRCLTGKSENSLVDPRHQGILFFKLYQTAMSRCREKNIHCVWGYTRQGLVWKKGLRFNVYDAIMSESVFVSNPFRALPEVLARKWRTRFKIAVACSLLPACLYSHLRRVWASNLLRKGSRKKYVVEDRLRRIGDLEELYRRLRKIHPQLIHLDQDENYLNWRIYKNPNVDYQTTFVYEGEMLRAYCYLSQNDKHTAFLTDFTFEEEDAGAFLLRAVLQQCRKQRAGLVYFMGNSKNRLIATVLKLLQGAGFVSKRSAEAFVLKNITYEDEEFLYDIRNWYVHGLWSEGYMI